MPALQTAVLVATAQTPRLFATTTTVAHPMPALTDNAFSPL